MSSTGDHPNAQHAGSSSMGGSGAGTSGQSGGIGGTGGHGHGGATDPGMSNKAGHSDNKSGNDSLFSSGGGSSKSDRSDSFSFSLRTWIFFFFRLQLQAVVDPRAMPVVLVISIDDRTR